MAILPDLTTLDNGPPKWLYPILTTQILASILFVTIGVGHIRFDGSLSQLGTGIYVGIIVSFTTIMQCILLVWKPTTVRKTCWLILVCKIFSVLSFVICLVNAPVTAVLSITHGDAFDFARKSCTINGGFSSFDCVVTGGKPDARALVCDILLFIDGLGTSYCVVLTASHLWSFGKRQRNVHAVTV